MTAICSKLLLEPSQQPGQRRPAPGRHRQPGPAGQVRRLLGAPLVTPYDIFRAYRDQNERVSAKLVEVPVEQVPRKVPEPIAGGDPGLLRQVQGRPSRPGPRDPRLQGPAPDPGRDPLDRRQCPGPGDQGQAHRGRAAGRLREPQVGIPGTVRPAQRPLRRPARADPAGHPAVRGRPQPAWPSALAEEKAQAEIVDKVHEDQGGRLDPVLRRLPAALDEIEEAKKQGTKAQEGLARRHDLKELAEREGLNYELTPLLSREQAEQYGQISGAEVGLAQLERRPQVRRRVLRSQEAPCTSRKS